MEEVRCLHLRRREIGQSGAYECASCGWLLPKDWKAPRGIVTLEQINAEMKRCPHPWRSVKFDEIPVRCGDCGARLEIVLIKPCVKCGTWPMFPTCSACYKAAEDRSTLLSVQLAENGETIANLQAEVVIISVRLERVMLRLAAYEDDRPDLLDKMAGLRSIRMPDDSA